MVLFVTLYYTRSDIIEIGIKQINVPQGNNFKLQIRYKLYKYAIGGRGLLMEFDFFNVHSLY